VSCNNALVHGLNYPLLNCGSVLLRDYSADYPVDKLVPGSPGQRLHFNPAVAVLPPASGLLLIPALPFRKSAYGLPVRDFWGLHGNLDSELSFELFERNLQMNLAHAGENHFLGFL